MSAAGGGRRFDELDPSLPPARKELAAALREAREHAGLSLRDLSQRAAISPGTLSRIFSGTRLPAPALMRALFGALEVDARTKDELTRLHTSAEDEAQLLRPEGPKQDQVGVELRRLRLAAGMSLTQLASLSHYSKSHLARIENGLRLPTPTALEALCQVLGASADETSQLLALLPETRPASTTAPHEPGAPNAFAASGLLLNLLNVLKRETELSVRNIAERIEASGIAASKSSIDRALQNPAEFPQTSMHVALVMIEELPAGRRGPIREALFQNLLALQGAASPEELKSTFWNEEQDLLVKQALAYEIEPGDEPAADDDVEAQALRNIYEDERLHVIFRALTPEQQRVVDAYAREDGASWADAAARAGVANPEVMGDLVRRKVRRLATETLHRPSSGSELVAAYRTKLGQEIDITATSSLPPAERRARLERVLGHLISREGPILSTTERSWLIRTVVDDVLELPMGWEASSDQHRS